jgi:hypothetical protein
MRLTRRTFIAAPAALALGAEPPNWTSKWDHVVLTAAVERLDKSFDPAANLLAHKIGPEYHYHTNLRSTTAHGTRDSLEYALLLLEANGGKSDRAVAIIDRLLALQDTAPESKWYGLWGYYLEEPASKMSPADWNWADFLGSLLLEIEFRHGVRLPEGIRTRVRDAIHHAAYSVRRRNVAMTYTNIAVQGTFVTLAAAEVLDDADLKQYAQDRLVRFARTVDETGSFTEYNSPTYANVTIANLTRMRMFVKDEDARRLAHRIEERAWLHLSRHWHTPTEQLAGPMSRCYQTDIGRPAWIQKALDGGVPLLSFEDLPAADVPGEVAILDYRCPDHLAGHFLSFGTSREHRELFVNAPDGVRPVQGTTWLGPECCLGSVNRGNFWVQSRPLVAYWGGPTRPGRYLQVRLMKDDYDFASGLLYAVQRHNYVLGVATFRSPGGDKHPSLDPVETGEFTCSRLRLRFDFANLPFNAPILVNGHDADVGEYEPGSRVLIELGGTYFWLRSLGARCGEPAGAATLAREEGLITVSVDFLKKREKQTVRWPRIANAVFALSLRESAGDSPEERDVQCAGYRVTGDTAGPLVRAVWDTPVGKLGVEAVAEVGEIATMDRTFRETLNGRPVPIERLTKERLVS